MYKLLEFLRSISIFLLFMAMEGGALLFYAHSDSYTQAKLLGCSAAITGGVGGVVRGVVDYFSLRSENDLLVQRIIELEEELDRQKSIVGDSLLAARSYVDEAGVEYYAAHVVSNSINRQRNYMMIDRGVSSGIREGMAVVTTSNQLVGRVVRCTSGYSIVMSVLNRDFRTSGVLTNGTYAGSIYWSGDSRYQVQMDDLSKYADIYVGLEVVTAGFSQVFPKGIVVGTVASYELNDLQTSYSVDVELAVDISSVDEVLVINNRRVAEGQQLLNDFESGEGELFN